MVSANQLLEAVFIAVDPYMSLCTRINAKYRVAMLIVSLGTLRVTS
jgi:hypothetical protein